MSKATPKLKINRLMKWSVMQAGTLSIGNWQMSGPIVATGRSQLACRLELDINTVAESTDLIARQEYWQTISGISGAWQRNCHPRGHSMNRTIPVTSTTVPEDVGWFTSPAVTGLPIGSSNRPDYAVVRSSKDIGSYVSTSQDDILNLIAAMATGSLKSAQTVDQYWGSSLDELSNPHILALNVRSLIQSLAG